MKDEFKIHWTKYCVANRVGNEIYLNQRLRGHPELLRQVVIHEKQHTAGFSIRDLSHDLKRHSYHKELRKFMAENPSTWLQVLPIWIKNGVVYWDINLLLIYSFWAALYLVVVGILWLVF